MSDLRTLMHEAAGPLADPPTAAVTTADRARGDRALRRHRVVRLGGGSGLIAVAAVGIFAIAVSSTGASTPSAPPTVASGTARSGSALTGTALVSYSGRQPVGYTLDKIPAGWTVRESDASLLVLAPAGTPAPADPGPDENGISTPKSLQGTIAVSTQSDGVPTGVPLDKVTVSGRPAVIAHLKGGNDTLTLFARQPSGTYLEIRAWTGLGWDGEQIVDFAESVHITDQAQKVRG